MEELFTAEVLLGTKLDDDDSKDDVIVAAAEDVEVVGLLLVTVAVELGIVRGDEAAWATKLTAEAAEAARVERVLAVAGTLVT